MGKKAGKWIAILMPFAWLVVIWFFSAQTGEESGAVSGHIVSRILGLFYPDGVPEQVRESYSFFVRKAAHMTEYAVLAVLWFRFFTVLISWKHLLIAVVSLALCLLCAAADEFHQTFVAGRSGNGTDVGIDFLGACIGAAVCLAWIRLRKGRAGKTA